MSLTFSLDTQVSDIWPHGPLVYIGFCLTMKYRKTEEHLLHKKQYGKRFLFKNNNIKLPIPNLVRHMRISLFNFLSVARPQQFEK